MSTSPMGANKPIEDIESCRVQADQSKSIHRARVNEHRRLRSIKFIIALTTEPSGPSNPDTEDPQFLPARPSYSQGLVRFIENGCARHWSSGHFDEDVPLEPQ